MVRGAYKAGVGVGFIYSVLGFYRLGFVTCNSIGIALGECTTETRGSLNQDTRGSGPARLVGEQRAFEDSSVDLCRDGEWRTS